MLGLTGANRPPNNGVSGIPKIRQQLISNPPAAATVLHATDAPRYYRLLSYEESTEGHVDTSWTVMIATNLEDSEIKYHCDGDRLYAGVEQGIFVLATSTGRLLLEIPDATCVGWFDVAPEGQILITAEDEIIAFNGKGQLIWRQNFPDVIENVTVTNRYVTVRTMSGNIYKVDLSRGLDCAGDSTS